MLRTVWILTIAATGLLAQRPPSAPPPPGCQCATGHWYDPNVQSCVTTACEVVAGMPDGDKGGGFFAWSGHLFKKTGCVGQTNSCLNGPPGTICTFAGNGTQGSAPDGTPILNGAMTPGILAFDKKFNALLFTENNKIRGVTPTNTFYTLAGSGLPGYQEGPALTAKMQDLSGLTTHPTLNWTYYSEHNFYGLIRGVNIASNVVTASLVAGDPTVGNQSVPGPATAGAKLWWPRDISITSGGVLYWVEHFNKKLRTIDNSGNVVDKCVFPGLTNITGFTLGNGQDVFLAEGVGNRVVRSNLSCAPPVNVVPAGQGYMGPLVFDSANDRLILRKGPTQVVQVKGVSTGSMLQAPSVLAGTGVFGATGDAGPATNATLKTVNGIAIGPGGHVYISTGEKIRVVKQ